MGSVVAQECSGSDSSHSLPKNSVAPATAMLSKSPPPSLRHLSTIMSNEGPAIPPLNAERFRGSFGHFCTVKGLDRVPEHVGQREVDLYSLHEQVMKHRGYINEKGEGFWLKIGRKLDFISPETSSASDEVADRLADIYKRYLEQFDRIYVMSFMQEVEHRRGRATLIG